jgi:hypothetical protein
MTVRKKGEKHEKNYRNHIDGGARSCFGGGFRLGGGRPRADSRI